MYTVLGEAQYQGVFKEAGREVPYEKIVLMVSNEGKYPEVISVDTDVYKRVGTRLLNKKINLLYRKTYGRYKIEKIELV